MSFVFPALLGAFVLAGIPVLLHLILRQKPKTLPFPALRFLTARHQANRRKLQLRQWLLLALRMLLIAGIVFAVARPRLIQGHLGLDGERPAAAVLVIDVSASMDARSSDNRSRLDDAKKRALEFLDALPPASRVAVLSSSDVRGEWSGTLQQARQRIRNLKIEPASPPLARAAVAGLDLLTEIAGREAEGRLPRLLCVFSDTTRGAWNAGQTPRFVEAADRVPVPRESLTSAEADIAGVLSSLKDDDASLRQTLTELRIALPGLKPGDFPLSGRPLQLVQQSRSAIRERLKELAGDDGLAAAATDLRRLLDRLIGYQSLWFDVGLHPARDLAILDVEWPLTPTGTPRESVRPGEAILLRPILQALGQDFQSTLSAAGTKEPREIKEGTRVGVPVEFDAGRRKLGPGYHSIEFELGVRDAFAANDRRFATVAVRPPRKAIAVGATKAEAGDFLRALAIHDVQVDVIAAEQVEAGIPSGYDAAFLFAVSAPSDKLWQALERFAKAGGGVAVVPGGDEMNPAAYRTVAAKNVLAGVYGKVVRAAKPGGKEAGAAWDWLDKAAFRHPMLQPFERWLIDDTIDFVKFPPRVFSYWETELASKDAVLIRYRDSDRGPALLERALGAGKVLQFTTTLDLREPAWNNYLETIHSFYVVVTGLMVRHLTGELEPIRANFLLGREEASFPSRALAGRGPLVLRGPESGPIAVDESRPRVAVPRATLPGNYQILDADKSPVAAFSMNLAPEEIDLTPWPADDLDRTFGGVRLPADRQANLRDLLAGRVDEPVELFPTLMVALLVLLAAENLLANWFYGRETT